MKTSGIGGQAVMEGVMMKNQNTYAIAVRKPDGEIEVKKDVYESVTRKHKLLSLPILRGMVVFAESMVVGMKALTYSSEFYEEEEAAKESKVESTISRIFKDKAESVIMTLTVLMAILMAAVLFIGIPYVVAGILSDYIDSSVLLALCEGVFRLVLFLGYVLLISLMNDIKRVFMYHGAEHKTINCMEHGYPLTVENVRGQSKEHKRCGTSFLVYVMLISIIFFTVIQVDNRLLQIVLRIVLIPVIAGVSYEFIRFAGRSNSKFMAVLSRPGMWVQGLTTREPDDDMIEVAIRSVDEVFDWKEFLEKEFPNGPESLEEVKKKRKVKDDYDDEDDYEEYVDDDDDKDDEEEESASSSLEEQNSETAVTKTEEIEESETQETETEESETIEISNEASCGVYFDVKPDDISDDDDEILTALDQYFADKEGQE